MTNEKDHASRFRYGKLLLEGGEKMAGLKEIGTASKRGYKPASAFLKEMAR